MCVGGSLCAHSETRKSAGSKEKRVLSENVTTPAWLSTCDTLADGVHSRPMPRWLSAIIGILLLFVPQALPLGDLSPAGAVALGLFAMAAWFWIMEPIPIYATSMAVILGQILLLSQNAPGVAYFDFPYEAGEAPSPNVFMGTLAHPILILFLGGFMLAAAAVKYSVEKGLTRVLLGPFGDRPSMVLLGLMISTAVLSAFMSNTATTAMMITVILPLLALLGKEDRFRFALALCIPLAANLGGVATPIGTPPNAIALAALAPAGVEIPFSTWMLMAVPLVAVSLFIGWRLLLIWYPPEKERLDLELNAKFPRSTPAVMFYFVGGATVLLWVTEQLHGLPSAVVAFLPVALLPCLGILDKDDIRGLSWEVLWLVAGGISLGLSLRDTGLAEWIITQIDWSSMSGIVLLLCFSAVTIAMANFLSNTVTASLIVPLTISIGTSGALGAGGSMAALTVGVAVSASYGMSLPISTPPNAIAFSTGLLDTSKMIRVGVVMAVVGLVLATLAARWYWPLFL